MVDKIFLSYARVDGSEFANKLFQDLEARGSDVWLDAEDIQPGMDWDSAIDQVLAQTQVAMLIVLTPGSILSPQVKSEWQDAINRHLPIIPLLAKECDIPRLLKTINYIDFQRGYNAGLAQLRRRLNSLSQDHVHYLETQIVRYRNAMEMAAPSEKQGFDNKIASLQAALSKWKQPEREATTAVVETAVKIEGDRIISIEGFVGRAKERRQVLDFLSSPTKRMLSITGDDRIGKSALISKVIQEISDDKIESFASPDTIVLLSSRTTGINLKLIVEKFGKALGGTQKEQLATLINNHSELDQEDINKFIQIIRRGFHMLILDAMDSIIDDKGQITDRAIRMFIGNLLGVPANTKLILTSGKEIKFRSEVQEQCAAIVLGPLTNSDAIAYIRRLDSSGDFQLRDLEEDDLSRLLDKVSRNPGRIADFVDVLHMNPFMSPKNALEQLTTKD